MQTRHGLPADDESLVAQAREDAEKNKRDAERFGHIEAPPGVQRIFHWELDQRHGGWCREFDLPVARPGGIIVGGEGVQFPDASIRGFITIENGNGQPLSAADARRIAELLIEAADNIEKLTGAQ